MCAFCKCKFITNIYTIWLGKELKSVHQERPFGVAPPFPDSQRGGITQSSVVVVLWGGGDRTTSLVTIIIISIYQTTGFRITHKFLRKAKTTLKLAERQNANGKRKKKMRARQRRRERRPKLEIQ